MAFKKYAANHNLDMQSASARSLQARPPPLQLPRSALFDASMQLAALCSWYHGLEIFHPTGHRTLYFSVRCPVGCTRFIYGGPGVGDAVPALMILMNLTGTSDFDRNLSAYGATWACNHAMKHATCMQVVALDNGYHGDTLGVMDCCPRSVFNEGQSPWYQPRGLFLSPPTCGVTCGRWEVRTPSLLGLALR